MTSDQLTKVCYSVRPLLWGIGILVGALGIAYAVRVATAEPSQQGALKEKPADVTAPAGLRIR
jgi:hypothetical protein